MARTINVVQQRFALTSVQIVPGLDFEAGLTSDIATNFEEQLGRSVRIVV